MICLLAFAGFASVAAAQPAPAPAVAPAAAGATDTTTFCYYEGKPYTKGAVLKDTVCAEEPILLVDGKPHHLIWQPKKK